MSSEDAKILEFNQCQISNKAPSIIYTHLECLIKMIDECKSNPQHSFTTKVSEHIPSGFSISRKSSFKSIEKNHDVYKDKDCMKKFCEYLREHTMEIINLKKKKVKLLTKQQQESYWNTKVCYICKKKLENKYVKDKKYCQVRDHCHYPGEYRDAAQSICNLKCNVPKRFL